MIYVPDNEDYSSCYEVLNGDVIRAYSSLPDSLGTYSYRDYYVNSNYIFKDNLITYTISDTLPVCLPNDLTTHDIYYRNDFWAICIIFMTCFFFIFYLPFKLYSRFFRRLK